MPRLSRTTTTLWSWYPRNRQLLFNKALAQVEIERYSGADSTYSELLRYYPNFDNGYLGRAQLSLAKADTIAARADIDKALREPTDKRIFVISKAFRAGYTVDQVHELTKIDKWFLEKLMNIMKTSKELHSFQLSTSNAELSTVNHQLSTIPVGLLRKAKVQGFSRFPDCPCHRLRRRHGKRHPVHSQLS